MKKLLIALAVMVVFILGVWLSDDIKHGVNAILDHEVFKTAKGLSRQLAESRRERDELKSDLLRRQNNLGAFVKDIHAKDYFTLTKESLLASAPSTDKSPGKVLLRPPSSEMLFRPFTTDDASLREIKEGLNSKIQTIMDVSKGILREKLAMLNVELIDMNTQLRDNNLALNEKLAEVEVYKQEVEKNKKYIQELEGISNDLKKSVADLETEIKDGKLKVSFKGDILFASGSHKLRDSGIRLLESVFPVLQKSMEKNDIFIAGHTDNVPIKKEFRHRYNSNWDLSTYRAIEVVKYLCGKGLEPQNLTAAGYGEYKPMAENNTESGRARNRRVELFVIPRIIQRHN